MSLFRPIGYSDSPHLLDVSESSGNPFGDTAELMTRVTRGLTRTMDRSASTLSVSSACEDVPSMILDLRQGSGCWTGSMGFDRSFFLVWCLDGDIRLSLVMEL